MFEVGNVVSLQHYSSVRLFACIVASIDNNLVSLKLPKGINLQLSQGDPLVLGSACENEVEITGCNVSEIDTPNSSVLVKLDTMNVSNERRLYKRHPLSSYADIIMDYNRKKATVILKDICEYSLRVFSKADLVTSQLIEINIYTENSVIFIKGSVVRVSSGPVFSEYGIKVKYENYTAANHVKQYIYKLNLQHEQYLSKLGK